MHLLVMLAAVCRHIMMGNDRICALRVSVCVCFGGGGRGGGGGGRYLAGGRAALGDGAEHQAGLAPHHGHKGGPRLGLNCLPQHLSVRRSFLVCLHSTTSPNALHVAVQLLAGC